MSIRMVEKAAEAHDFPLLVKYLLPDPRTTTASIVSGDLRLNYDGLIGRIGRLGRVLENLGVRPGDTVAVMNWDDHRYLECFFAIPMSGAVLQTVNVRMSPEQVIFTLQQSGASILFYHPDFAPLVQLVKSRIPQLRLALVFTGGALGDLDGARDYDAALAEVAPDYEFPDFDERAVATTFHTTGTSGPPKCVSFSHRQLVLHTLGLCTTLANQPDGQGYRRQNTYMPLTPMFHVHAWGVPYIATMLGAKQVFPGRYAPDTLLDLRIDEGVNFSHCVPTLLQMVLDAADKRGIDLSDHGQWTMLVGGAPLPRSLADRAQKAGITTVVGYGMSETGPAISVARSEERDPEALRRGGYPLPLVQVKIDSDANGGDGTGEVTVRSPWATLAYAGQPQASEDLWRGGWLHTMDVARFSASGEIEVSDRLKDVIKTGGEWLSSPQLEELAMQATEISAVAFVAKPDDRWGERPVAFVVLTDGCEGFDVAGLCAHLSRHVDAGIISKYALPDEMIVLPTLPLTSVGKIDKKALRAGLHHEGSPT